jgi:hypothetical protein
MPTALTIKKVMKNYRSVAGNLGSLIIFNENHEDGDFKGKSVVTWNKNPEYIPEDLSGWQLDDELDKNGARRISEPLISLKQMRRDDAEFKVTIAHKLGIEFSGV